MEKIGVKETSRLFSILIVSTVTLDAIWGFVHNSGTAAFINAILGLIFVLAVVLFSKKAFKNSNFEVVLKNLYGNWVSTFLILLLLVLTILSASSRMGIFADAIGEYVLSETPRIFILILFCACIFTAVFFGIEAITRYALSVFIAFSVFLAIILLSSYTEVKAINLSPILGKGSFINVFDMMYVFSDIIYMYLIIGYVADRKKANNVIIRATLTGGIISVICTLFYTLCVPYPVSKEFLYPLYRLASLSNSSVVFQRLDGLVFLIWMFIGFVSVSALTLFAIIIFARLFKLNDTRALSAPFSLMVLLIAVDGSVNTEFIRNSMTMYTFLVLIITSLIYRLKYVWRKKNV